MAAMVVSVSGSVNTVAGLGASLTSNAPAVAAPGAGASLASVTATTAGVYDVKVTVNIGGTTSASEVSNVAVTANSQTTRIANGVGAASTFSWFQTVPSSGTIAATSVGAATAGSVYGVTIVATRVS